MGEGGAGAETIDKNLSVHFIGPFGTYCDSAVEMVSRQRGRDGGVFFFLCDHVLRTHFSNQIHAAPAGPGSWNRSSGT